VSATRAIAQATLRLATRPLQSTGALVDCDAVVVLGSPVHADGSLPPTVRERVEVGIETLRKSSARLLVFSGGSVRGPEEARAMAAHAHRLGVDESEVLVEDQSKTTYENAQRCAELLLPSCRRVAVVSQPFHLRRACFLFRKVGFDPVGHCAADSVHFRDPLRGWRWTAREYGAWGVTVVRTLGDTLKGSRLR